MTSGNALGLVIGMSALAGMVSAQPTAQSGVAATTEISSGSTDALQEIIVTAQRRSEDVQRAALAIDVVSPQALGLAGATRATDIAGLVPALQISDSGNSEQSLYLRSVGTFTANAYSDPAVAFNVDGVAIGRPSSMTGVLYDLQRVEVLKGPQGTLYGRNATGGAINVLPNQPRLGVTEGEVALTVGNYGEVHPEMAANLALNDSSAARLAFTYTRHDAFQSDECFVRVWMVVPEVGFRHKRHADYVIIDPGNHNILVLPGELKRSLHQINKIQWLRHCCLTQYGCWSSRPPIHHAILHHQLHILQRVDLLRRIACHRDHIRQHARMQAAKLFAHADHRRIRRGRRSQRLYRRHAVAHHPR